MQISERYQNRKYASKIFFANSSTSLCPAIWYYSTQPGVDRIASTPGAAPTFTKKQTYRCKKYLDVVFTLRKAEPECCIN
jgi:hypothetical protein